VGPIKRPRFRYIGGRVSSREKESEVQSGKRKFGNEGETNPGLKTGEAKLP